MSHGSAKAQDSTAEIAQMITMRDLPFIFIENPERDLVSANTQNQMTPNLFFKSEKAARTKRQITAV